MIKAIMIRTMGIAKLMLSRDIIFSCTTDNRITIKKLAVIIKPDQVRRKVTSCLMERFGSGVEPAASLCEYSNSQI